MDLQINYKTKQRELVLSCLAETNGRHFTADDIAEMLDKKGTHVGKTTVYRHLDRFLSEGIIRKYTLGDKNCACYQYSDGTKCEHFHLKCIKCSKLIHADCDFLDKLSSHVEVHHDFVIDGSRTVFYGLCSDCRDTDYSEKTLCSCGCDKTKGEQ